MRVEIADVSIAFNDQVVFSGVSGKIPERKLTALVGPSGSGKSSLLAVLAGFDVPAAGRITFYGQEQAESPGKSDVILLPQGANSLPHRTVLDNVVIAPLANGLPRSDSEERAINALRLVGLGDKASMRARTLSGGELQRLALARGLASNRPLMLIDEPSAGLDLENVRLISRLLRDLARFATVVVATHDEFLRENADNLIDLRRAG